MLVHAPPFRHGLLKPTWHHKVKSGWGQLSGLSEELSSKSEQLLFISFMTASLSNSEISPGFLSCLTFLPKLTDSVSGFLHNDTTRRKRCESLQKINKLFASEKNRFVGRELILKSRTWWFPHDDTTTMQTSFIVPNPVPPFCLLPCDFMSWLPVMKVDLFKRLVNCSFQL